jgi:hypothetical protein
MAKYDVLSIDPKTNLLESMPFETLEQAESHRRRARKEGRLLVEIIDSPAQFREWKKKAQETVKHLKEAAGP